MVKMNVKRKKLTLFKCFKEKVRSEKENKRKC